MIDIEKFKAARDAADLSQARLAKIVGVSQQLIGEIERGTARTTKAIYRIAEALNVGAHELDDEIPAPPENPVDWDDVTNEVRELTPTEQQFALNNLRAFIQHIKNTRKTE